MWSRKLGRAVGITQQIEYVMFELREYLCVSQIFDEAGKYKLRIAAHVTVGRLHQSGEKIVHAKDILVLNGVVDLSFDGSIWYVRYNLGQTLPTNEHEDIIEATEFIKQQIERYWKKKDGRSL